MNILFVCPNSPKISVGGIERYIQNLIKYCQRKQGKYHFLLPSNGKDHSTKKDNITIYYKDFLSLSYKKRKTDGGKGTSQKEVQKKSEEFFKFLLDLFESQKIEVVVAQNFHLGMPPAYSLVLNMACFTANIPVLLRVHSFAVKDIQKEVINQLFWEKISCVSKSVAGDCFQKGASINKITTNYLGVDTKEFERKSSINWLRKGLDIPKESRIILCASRILLGYKEILKEKGIIKLIEAFSKLTPRYDNLKLVIAIGTPPKRLKKEFEQALEKLKGFIKLHNVENKVICKTFALEQMPLVYNGADVFVLPSENETFGQVYIEAMACGVPVIGTKVGAVSEIITNDYNGLLVRDNDASVLAQKIEEIINNNDLREKFIKNGLKTVNKKFSSQKLFDSYFAYLEKLIRVEA